MKKKKAMITGDKGVRPATDEEIEFLRKYIEKNTGGGKHEFRKRIT